MRGKKFIQVCREFEYPKHTAVADFLEGVNAGIKWGQPPV